MMRFPNLVKGIDNLDDEVPNLVKGIDNLDDEVDQPHERHWQPR